MEKITRAIKMAFTQYQMKLNQEITQQAEHVAHTKHFSRKTQEEKQFAKPRRQHVVKPYTVKTLATFINLRSHILGNHL